MTKLTLNMPAMTKCYHCWTVLLESEAIIILHILISERRICVALSAHSSALLSVYLTDLKLHKTKYILSKIAPSGVWTRNLWIISVMLYQLSKITIWLSVWIIKVFIKSYSIDFGNEKSPKCELVHETNIAYFRNLLPNRFLPSSVGRALEVKGSHPFFSLNLDLSDNLTEMRQTSLSWKTRLVLLVLCHCSTCSHWGITFIWPTNSCLWRHNFRTLLHCIWK